MFTRTVVNFEGREYLYLLTGEAAPSSPIEEKGGRFYIVMGFAGFNTRANNLSGYASRGVALQTIRKYQGKGAR